MEEEKKDVLAETEIPFQKKADLPAEKPKRKKRIPVPAWITFACAIMLATGIGGFHIYQTVHGQDLNLLTSEITPPQYGLPGSSEKGSPAWFLRFRTIYSGHWILRMRMRLI